MRPATLNAIFPQCAYLLLLLLNFVNGERSVCRRRTGPARTTLLLTQNVWEHFRQVEPLKWHLTLIREYKKVGKRFFFVTKCMCSHDGRMQGSIWFFERLWNLSKQTTALAICKRVDDLLAFAQSKNASQRKSLCLQNEPLLFAPLL